MLNRFDFLVRQTRRINLAHDEELAVLFGSKHRAAALAFFQDAQEREGRTDVFFDGLFHDTSPSLLV